jgi:hypothetical protein
MFESAPKATGSACILGHCVDTLDREEHMGRMDIGVLLIRKLWLRELRALASGRPLTQWRHTPIDATRYGRLNASAIVDTSFMDGLRASGFLRPAEARQS